MKITAEFNSNEELLSFISAFGAKTFKPEHGLVVEGPKESKKVELPREDKKEASKIEASNENKKEDVPKVNAEVVEENQKITEVKDAKEVKEEDPKITKEMVRAVFTKLIKAGKQKEAKEITEKYGAKKLPDLAEEHYAAAYKEAEGLL